MPDSRFNIDTASVEDLRQEAEELDDVAEALLRCADRGHCASHIQDALRQPSSVPAALFDRADELRDLAAFMSANPVNKVAT